MAEDKQHGSLENTLFQLLNISEEQKLETENLLLLLGLVNLMGIVNLIAYRQGGAALGDMGAAKQMTTEAKGAAPVMPPNLAGLLGSLLGPGGPRNPSERGPEGSDTTQPDEDNEKKK